MKKTKIYYKVCIVTDDPASTHARLVALFAKHGLDAEVVKTVEADGFAEPIRAKKMRLKVKP